jgi:hypothetical protein
VRCAPAPRAAAARAARRADQPRHRRASGRRTLRAAPLSQQRPTGGEAPGDAFCSPRPEPAPGPAHDLHEVRPFGLQPPPPHKSGAAALRATVACLAASVAALLFI